MTRLQLALCLLSCAALGCENEPVPTQVMVLIGAESKVRRDTHSLFLRVANADSEDIVLELEEEMPEPWPYRLPLVPLHDDADRRYRVVAEARTRTDGRTTTLARASLTSSFVAHEKRYVTLLLEDDCIGGPLCRPDESCHAGVCWPASVNPSDFARDENDAPAAWMIADRKPPATDAAPVDAEADTGSRGTGGDAGADGGAVEAGAGGASGTAGNSGGTGGVAPATCQCPGISCCNDRCVDLGSDESHCGACGAACPEHATCSSRGCACDDGFEKVAQLGPP
jgi:hypothetical protein